MQKATFLVLVAGDKAQCVSLANWKENRTKFLYHGSPYSKSISYPVISEELASDHIPMQFFSTMACFQSEKFSCVIPFHSMFLILPKTLEEREFPHYFHLLENFIDKSLKDSVWITERGSYNERTLSLLPNKHC